MKVRRPAHPDALLTSENMFQKYHRLAEAFFGVSLSGLEAYAVATIMEAYRVVCAILWFQSHKHRSVSGL